MLAIQFLLAAQVASAFQAKNIDDVVRLQTYVSPVEYFNAVYVEPVAGATYLYYEKERIRFEISVVNRGSVPVLIPVAGDPSTHVSLRMESETKGSLPLGRGRWTVSAGVRIRQSGAPAMAVVGGSNVVLQPGATLVLPIDFDDSVRWPRGATHLTADVSMQCQPTCAVAPDANVYRVEVRPVVEQADRMEYTYRRALRALRSGDLATAERALQGVDSEIAGTPTALYAHGIVAERAGNGPVALRFFRSAEAALLSQGQSLDVRRLGPSGINEFARTLRGNIRRLEGIR